MIKFALYDFNTAEPIAICTLDWDPEERGPFVRIPVPTYMAAAPLSANEVATVTAPDVKILNIELREVRTGRRTATSHLEPGWLGITKTPELAMEFFENE